MGLLDIIFPKRCVGCGRVGLPAGPLRRIEASKAGGYFCDQCRTSIKVIAPNESICPVCEKPAIDGRTHPKCQSRYALDGLTSFFRYDGVVRKAIKAIKYRYISDLASEFISLIPSSLLIQVVPLGLSREGGNLLYQMRIPAQGRNDDHSDSTCLVPIPLHSSRMRFRGFNQAEVLGKILVQRFSITLCSDVLFRTKATTPQVDMKHREERLKNMEDAFGITSFWQARLQARPESHRDAGQASMTSKNNNTIILFDDVFTTGATMRAAAKVLKQAGAGFVWAITIAR